MEAGFEVLLVRMPDWRPEPQFAGQEPAEQWGIFT